MHERNSKPYNFVLTEQVDVAIAMQPTSPNILLLLLWITFSFEKTCLIA
jgi:hypothetical protein